MNKTLSQLRILYLIKTMGIGGAERFTFNLCKYFSKRVDHITVFSSGGIFVEELNKLGINHISSTFANGKNFLKLRKQIKDLIKNNNFDIIHCQHRIFLPILRTIKTGNTKLIYTANNFFNDIYQKVLFPDAAVAISPSIEKNLLETTFLHKRKIFRINYGVEIRDIFKPSDENIALGFVGRLIREKGIYQLIEAFKEITTERFRLIICGDGPEKNNILKIIQNEGPASNIRLIPPTIEIDQVYKLIDILILPTSLNEGLPISILEALVRKIIVVTTEKGAIKDIIVDNETGFILKDNTVAGIIENVDYLVKNSRLLGDIKEKGYNKVKNDYSIDVMLEGYKRLYLKMLN